MSNVTRKEFNALSNALLAISAHLGLVTQSDPEFSAPKTSVRMSDTQDTAAMASKSRKGTKSLVDDVVKVVTEAETRNRMKLPARMFGTATKCIVDGNTFEQCDSDQNRSLPFSPDVFGADAGDEITFTNTGKQGGKLVWDYVVVAGSPKRGKKSAAKKAAPAREEKPTAKPKASGTKASSIKSLIAEFAEKCIDNAAAAKYSRKHKLDEDDEDFFELPPFEGTQGDRDARSLLTLKERGQLRKARKALGLDLPTLVEMLNDAVYE